MTELCRFVFIKW